MQFRVAAHFQAAYAARVKIAVAVRSDVGRVRKHNEDRAVVDEALGLYVVCDGMGGHAAGEVASELAGSTVLQTVRAAAGLDKLTDELSATESERIEAVLRSALENANARVRELGVQDPSKRGAGTTCSALLIRQGRGFIAHVGDSRIYLRRGGAVHRLTIDHSLIERAIEQGMPREEAEARFPSNALVRAIGPHPTLVVDTLVFDVLPNDTFLLCSDGLHEYFPDEVNELCQLLEEELQPLADKLIALANERGGGDNITGVVVRAEPQESEALRTTLVRNDLEALWRMPLFNDMSYPELLEIVDVVQSESVEAGHAIVTEGETSDSLYVISSGKVQVERANQTIAELGSGSHFGEMAVLTSRPRAATVRALESTRLLALTRPAISALFARRPAIGMKFLWTLAQVQSIRLDEALVWRPVAPDEPEPRTSLLEELERTVKIENAASGLVDGRPTFKSNVETKRMFLPPLSRHR